ncbi:zinc-binding dehydrogenase [Streptomyces nogalater]
MPRAPSAGWRSRSPGPGESGWTPWSPVRSRSASSASTVPVSSPRTPRSPVPFLRRGLRHLRGLRHRGGGGRRPVRVDRHPGYPVPDLSSRGVRTTVHQVREDGAGLRELSGLVDHGSLRPRVHAAFGLHEIRAAHVRFAQGGLAGKIAMVF